MQEYIKDHKFHLERERRYVLDCYLLSSLLPSSSHTVTSKVTKKSKEMSRTGYKPVPQVPGDKRRLITHSYDFSLWLFLLESFDKHLTLLCPSFILWKKVSLISLYQKIIINLKNNLSCDIKIIRMCCLGVLLQRELLGSIKDVVIEEKKRKK